MPLLDNLNAGGSGSSGLGRSSFSQTWTCLLGVKDFASNLVHLLLAKTVFKLIVFNIMMKIVLGF